MLGKPSFGRDLLASSLLFVLQLVVYVMSSNTMLYDSLFTVHLAASLIHERDLDLDEYAALIPTDDYRIIRANGHTYSYFPIGFPIAATPFVWVAEHLIDASGRYEDDFYTLLQQDLEPPFLPAAERLLGALFTSLTGVVMYFVGRQRLSIGRAVFLALLFAFGTSAWSLTSRGSWQHGPSMLMLSLVLLLLMQAERRPSAAALAALPLALSYVFRPSNSIAVLFVTIYVLVTYPRQFLRYLLLAGTVAIPFLIYTYAVYGSLFAPYYLPARLGASSFFAVALLGNLISPARGLFVYSPLYLFVFYGFYLGLRAGGRRGLDLTLAAIVLAHWLVVSSFPHWYGGWSVGPRFMTDMLPFLTYFLIPVVQELRWRHATFHQRTVTALFAATSLWSVMVHGYSANSSMVLNWNKMPVNVDAENGRLWDWRDPPFLRGTFLQEWLTAPKPIASAPLLRFNLKDAPASAPLQTQLTVVLAAASPYYLLLTPSSWLTLMPDAQLDVAASAHGAPSLRSRKLLEPYTPYTFDLRFAPNAELPPYAVGSLHLSLEAENLADDSAGRTLTPWAFPLSHQPAAEVLPIVISAGQAQVGAHAVFLPLVLATAQADRAFDRREELDVPGIEIKSKAADSRPPLRAVWGVGWQPTADGVTYSAGSRAAYVHLFAEAPRRVTLSSRLRRSTAEQCPAMTWHLRAGEESIAVAAGPETPFEFSFVAQAGWNSVEVAPTARTSALTDDFIGTDESCLIISLGIVTIRSE